MAEADFRLIEQCTRSFGYVLHVWDNETHFKAWQIVHHNEHLHKCSDAKGSLRDTQIHAFDDDARVDRIRDQLEYGTPAFDMSKTQAQRSARNRKQERLETIAASTQAPGPRLLTPADFEPTQSVRLVFGRVYRRYHVDRYDVVLTEGQRIGVQHPDGVLTARVVKVQPNRVEIEFDPCNRYRTNGRRREIDMTTTGVNLTIDKVIVNAGL